MAGKRRIRFRKNMAEQSARDAPEVEEIRLSSEAGYTKTNKKSRFKGNTNYGEDLRFGRKTPEKPKTSKTVSSAAVSAKMHAAVDSENPDDNAGGKALNRGSEAVEDTGRAAENIVRKVRYSKKLKASKAAKKLQTESGPASRMGQTAKEANQAGKAATQDTGNGPGCLGGAEGSGCSDCDPNRR